MTQLSGVRRIGWVCAAWCVPQPEQAQGEAGLRVGSFGSKPLIKACTVIVLPPAPSPLGVQVTHDLRWRLRLFYRSPSSAVVHRSHEGFHRPLPWLLFVDNHLPWPGLLRSCTKEWHRVTGGTQPLQDGFCSTSQKRPFLSSTCGAERFHIHRHHRCTLSGIALNCPGAANLTRLYRCTYA